MVLETAAYSLGTKLKTYRIPTTGFVPVYSIVILLTLEKGEEATEECLSGKGLTAETGIILKRF